MYSTSGATIRHDLNTVVIEASQADKNYLGPILFPFFGVDTKAGIYPKLKKTSAELLKPGSTDRERSGSYGQIKRAWENDNYDTQDRGIEEAIDDTDARDIGRWFDLEAITAKLVLRSMMLAAEIRVAAATFNTTTFGAATNSSVAYTELNIATIDPVKDIQDAIERIRDNAEEPDTIVMSSSVYNRLRRSTLLKSFITGQNLPAANITPNTIQQAFADSGIKNVLIGRGRYDGSKKNATPAYTATKVWADTYIFVGKTGSGDPYNGGMGRTLGWNKEGGEYVTETYRKEDIRSNIVRVRQHTIEKVIDASCGTLIATQYS